MTDDQLGGLKEADQEAYEFVAALSDQQRGVLSFDPGRSNRLIDPLDNPSDLLLPGLDPVA